MSTAPTAAVAAKTPTTEQRQRAIEEALAVQLGPPPSSDPPADTQAAQAAQAAAERALAALEASAQALERAYTVAAERADVAAMSALAEKRPLQQRELLTLAVTAAKTVEHAYGLQVRDAQAALGPLREWAGRAELIADEAREVATLALEQSQRAIGLGQHAQRRVEQLSAQAGQARQAVSTTAAHLSAHLGGPPSGAALSSPGAGQQRPRLLL